MKACPECSAPMEENETRCKECEYDVTEPLVAEEQVAKASDEAAQKSIKKKPTNKKDSEKEIAPDDKVLEETREKQLSEEGSEEAAPDNKGLEAAGEKPEATLEAVEGLDEAAVVNKEEKPKKGNFLLIALLAAALILGGIVLVPKLGGSSIPPMNKLKYDPDAPNNMPVIYMAKDDSAKGGATVRISGKGMKEEAVLSEQRMIGEYKFLPMLPSPKGDYFAYVGADSNLYLLDRISLSGTKETDPKTKIADKVQGILEFSPESNLLYYMNGKGWLSVYDGKETRVLDTTAVITQLSNGGLTFRIMENGHIVYIKSRGNEMWLAMQVRQADGTFKQSYIAPSIDFQVLDSSAEGLLYYLDSTKVLPVATEEQRKTEEAMDWGNPETAITISENILKEEALVQPVIPQEAVPISDQEGGTTPTQASMSPKEDAEAPQEGIVNQSGGVAGLDTLLTKTSGEAPVGEAEPIEETGSEEALLEEAADAAPEIELTEEEMKKLFSSYAEPPAVFGYFYDFETGDSTLLSEKMGQVVWSDGGKHIAFTTMEPSSESIPSVSIYYFDGKKEITLIDENASGQFYESVEWEYLIYEKQEGEESARYLVSFTDSKLHPKVEVSRTSKDQLQLFAPSKTRNELYVFTRDLESGKITTGRIMVGEDGTVSELEALPIQMDYILYEQMDGSILYLKNIDDSGLYADLYYEYGGEERLAAKNVWLPTVNIPQEQAEKNGEFLFLAMEERGMDTYATGTLYRLKDGETEVIGEGVGTSAQVQAAPVIYRSSELFYYFSLHPSQGMGGLYRYYKGEVTLLSNQVYTVL